MKHMLDQQNPSLRVEDNSDYTSRKLRLEKSPEFASAANNPRNLLEKNADLAQAESIW